jgi:hypothetical protein
MPNIRIIAVPPGEAPVTVRKAWVGLTLPVGSDQDKRVWHSAGVLSGPKSWVARLGWLILGKFEKIDGYAVDASTAIAILAKSDPTAADWWETNAPRLLESGRKFVFHAEVCQEIE